MGVGEGVVALSDNMGYPAVFRLFGLANLLVIPLLLIIARKCSSPGARTETDLIIDGTWDDRL